MHNQNLYFEKPGKSISLKTINTSGADFLPLVSYHYCIIMKVPSISAKPDTLRKFNSELSHAIVKAHVNKNKNELKKLDVMERCIIAISKYRNIYKNVKNIRMCSTKGQEESKDDEEEMEETEKAEEKAEMVEMEEREETEETENDKEIEEMENGEEIEETEEIEEKEEIEETEEIEEKEEMEETEETEEKAEMEILNYGK